VQRVLLLSEAAHSWCGFAILGAKVAGSSAVTLLVGPSRDEAADGAHGACRSYGGGVRH